jgi:hypothetical protein
MYPQEKEIQCSEVRGVRGPRYWFQHDGAPAHCTNVVREYLDETFGNRRLGRGGPVTWPPGSPNYIAYFLFYLVCEAIPTAATPGILCQPRVIVKMIVEKQMECRLTGETEVLGDNLPQRHFCPSQNPTWPEPGLNPGRRGGKKPATNRLSYGAADYIAYSLIPTEDQSANTYWRWFPARGFFYPEDGGGTFLRNVGLPIIYTALYPRRRHCS